MARCEARSAQPLTPSQAELDAKTAVAFETAMRKLDLITARLSHTAGVVVNVR
jgi:hypothetical protein